jgi:hypothetical protein
MQPGTEGLAAAGKPALELVGFQDWHFCVSP